MSHKAQIKSLVNRLLALFGCACSPLTSHSSLASLLRDLHPLRADVQLVRLGSQIGDGGYVIPNDLAGVGACFSPGVGGIATFEADIIKKAIPVYLADASVTAAPENCHHAHFLHKHLGSVDDDGRRVVTLDTWVKTAEQDNPAIREHDLLLQMDVEGAEYAIIHNVSTRLLQRFRIIVLEMHFLDRLARADCFELLEPAFRKLLLFHRVVHIHPNNCSHIYKFGSVAIPDTMEFTFLRRDRFKSLKPATDFPHHLDHPNVENRRDITLPKCWHVN